MNELLRKVAALGIVPVVKLDNANKALPLANALCEGGLPVAEITFRTSEAEEAIRLISRNIPKMLVGAGTVLTVEQVERAIAAGAKFIVCPGFNKSIVEYCINKGVQVIPGTSCPSDMEAAMELGLEVVKFFPAEQSGGVEYLKAVSGPYPKLKFMPTGGINAKNLNDYLLLKNVVACGGTWMVKPELINADKFDEIAALTDQAVRNMLGFELCHIGLNFESKESASDIAKTYCDLFGFGYKEGKNSIFAGKGIEVMKQPAQGRFGHIGICTNHIDRAIEHFKTRGIGIDESSRKYDDNGNLEAVFFKEEYGGFAIHLMQR